MASAAAIKARTGVRTLDIAKRLIDHGFHPPTIYFPLIVEEGMLIEPTETESVETLDAFADALIAIAAEAESDPDIVRSAPHTAPVRRLDEATAARQPNLRWRADGRRRDAVPGLMAARSAVAGLLAITLIIGGCDANLPSPVASHSPSGTIPPSTPPAVVIDLTLTAYVAEAGTDGGAAVIGDWRQANQFNPYYLGQGSEQAVASAAWATLVTVTHDRRYLPDLATAVPTVDNGGVESPGEGDDAMTVNWRLRDGLKWSDGEALTCDDFKYTWEWVLDDDNFGVVTAGYEDIEDLQCKSDTEMIWHFGTVYEGYLTLLSAPLPRHHLEPIPMDQQTQGVGFRPDEIAKLPVSGPFRFETVTPDVELKMAKNPAYVSPRTGKPAHLEFADVSVVPGPGRADCRLSGGCRERRNRTHGRRSAGAGGPGRPVRDATFVDVRGVATELVGGDLLDRPAVRDRGVGCPMADPTIRQALALAIDRNAIVTKALGRTVAVPATNVDPLAWFYAEQAVPPFDLAEAIQILEEAGWTDTHGDQSEKEGLEAESRSARRSARLGWTPPRSLRPLSRRSASGRSRRWSIQPPCSRRTTGQAAPRRVHCSGATSISRSTP